MLRCGQKPTNSLLSSRPSRPPTSHNIRGSSDSLKGFVVLLKGLDIRHGVFKEAGSYAQPAYQVEYVAQLKKPAVDGLVADLEAEISALQDELDEFNHLKSVELTV